MATQHELRQEGEIEPDEYNHRRYLSPELVVHLSNHLGPPVEDASKKRYQRSTHHHVVEVCHHEVGVVQVTIGR